MDKTRLMPERHWDWTIPSPFSQGWRVGDMVFVGGQVAYDENGTVVGKGDIEVQTRTTCENISKVLKLAGADWRDIVKLNTYYVYDGPIEGALAFWQKMSRVRFEFLADPGPCGTAVRVPGLSDPELLVEIEAIAMVGEHA
jgi:2-iminobutanoate/2-iminopropanoate deaminase